MEHISVLQIWVAQMKNIIGHKVQQARMESTPKITQEHLAVKLQIHGWNIDRFGISKLERGERQVTDKEIVLLSKVLNVSFDYLFGE